MGFEDLKEPYYLRDLIKVIGGEPISYSEQYSCCGGGLSVGRKDDVVPSARRILLSSLDAGAKAIVTNCPFCFAQFYRSQKEINDIYAEGLHLPVFYITQLMGLTFGISPEELGMELHHKDSVGNEKELIKQFLSEKIDERVFTDEITKSQLELCAKCFACTDDCPTAMTTSEYHPEEILELILNGKVDEAIKREDIWFCMNCHECIERCPQRFGMVKLIVRLKNLAVASGIYPDVIGRRTTELHDSGYSFSPAMDIREEVDLPKISMPDIKKLRKLMEETKAENSDNGDD
jgi:heterodisulfide reductase subunit C